MLDKKRINIIIEDIEMYFNKLKDRNIKKISDLDDLNFYASSMILFSILNRTIDLGDEIVRSKKLGYPSETKEIFDLLKENKIIKKDLSENLKDLIRLRNKFAHRYGIIKKNDVLNAIKQVNVIKDFIKEVIKYVK